MDGLCTTALDIEECPGSEEDDHVHIFVADVVKSFAQIAMSSFFKDCGLCCCMVLEDP